MTEKVSHYHKARLAIFAIGIALATYKFGIVEGLHFFEKILAFVVILSFIVFIHEFGHYIVAKWCGVKIDAFSIGFGKELFGWNDKSGTRWKVSMLPLGGYVKMFGDANEASAPGEGLENLTEAEKKVTFHFKPIPQKIAVVAAGPAFNFILTIIIFTAFLMTNGLQSTEPVIGELIKGAPAEKAGLLPGDRILSINGETIEVFNDIPRNIMTNLGTPVKVAYERNGVGSEMVITPEIRADKDQLGNEIKRPMIGFKSKDIKFKDVGPVKALQVAVEKTYDLCAMTTKALWQMITGKRSPSQLQGPLGIAKMSGQAASQGMTTVFWFVALISANLGFVNILPIPMLDGGHIVFYLIEALIGRPINRRVQEMCMRLGMAMLAMLMAYSFFNDVRNMVHIPS